MINNNYKSEKGPVDDHGKNGSSYNKLRTTIYDHYSSQRREFDWRRDITPYRVFVSEVMLQQTQTTRVSEKFGPFIEAFPDFKALAVASFSDVLRLWKGLGYNRRAGYLQRAAAIIVDDYNSQLPEDPDLLVHLPGIGPATAASICVFAFNQPLTFIETNIRTVYIHFFFNSEDKIADARIMPLIEKSVDPVNPREWYYALMDYGVMLKKTVGNLNRRSSHYNKQSRFEGSDRQIRGRILQLLLDHPVLEEDDLPGMLSEPPERCARIMEALCREGLVSRKDDNYLQLS